MGAATPTNPVVSPLLLDLLGVFAFGLSGGLVAVRKRLDLFGVLVLAGATGLGGGVLRDLLTVPSRPSASATGASSPPPSPLGW